MMFQNEQKKNKGVHAMLVVVGVAGASGWLELALVTWKPEGRLRLPNVYLVVLLL